MVAGTVRERSSPAACDVDIHADDESSQPVGHAPMMHRELLEGVEMVAGTVHERSSPAARDVDIHADTESSQPVGHTPMMHRELLEGVEMASAKNTATYLTR